MNECLDYDSGTLQKYLFPPTILWIRLDVWVCVCISLPVCVCVCNVALDHFGGSEGEFSPFSFVLHCINKLKTWNASFDRYSIVMNERLNRGDEIQRRAEIELTL